jgi:hypothetical protein
MHGMKEMPGAVAPREPQQAAAVRHHAMHGMKEMPGATAPRETQPAAALLEFGDDGLGQFGRDADVCFGGQCQQFRLDGFGHGQFFHKGV